MNDARCPEYVRVIRVNMSRHLQQISLPRKGKRYTLLLHVLDACLIKGWGSKDSWLLIVSHNLCAMIKKFYHGIQKAVHQF